MIQQNKINNKVKVRNQTGNKRYFKLTKIILKTYKKSEDSIVYQTLIKPVVT